MSPCNRLPYWFGAYWLQSNQTPSLPNDTSCHTSPWTVLNKIEITDCNWRKPIIRSKFQQQPFKGRTVTVNIYIDIFGNFESVKMQICLDNHRSIHSVAWSHTNSSQQYQNSRKDIHGSNHQTTNWSLPNKMYTSCPNYSSKSQTFGTKGIAKASNLLLTRRIIGKLN